MGHVQQRGVRVIVSSQELCALMILVYGQSRLSWRVRFHRRCDLRWNSVLTGTE